MKIRTPIIGAMGVVLFGLWGCGDDAAGTAAGSSGPLSGSYVAELGDIEHLGSGIRLELDFNRDGTAMFYMGEGDRRGEGLDCTYTSGEARIAVSCFGSSGISLTRLSSGDLEGDMDGMIVRYRPQ